jgi:hypothetical protein
MSFHDHPGHCYMCSQLHVFLLFTAPFVRSQHQRSEQAPGIVRPLRHAEHLVVRIGVS